MRRLNANDPTTTTLGVRLPADVLTALDAEVDRVNALAVGATATRSTVARAILARVLLRQVPAPASTVAPAKPYVLVNDDLALERDELREVFSSAIAEGRTTYEAAATACGCSAMPLRSWASGRARDGKRAFKPLATAYRELLSRYLAELVPISSTGAICS